MKFIVKKEILLESLNNTARAISTKNLIPILTGIKFDLKDDGLYLYASDTDVSIRSFISKDKLSAAQNFKKELLKTIKALSDFPLKYRKSYYFDDENIRDLTFKGYTIVYEVDFDKKEIFVFHIFNKNLPINIKKENENDSY